MRAPGLVWAGVLGSAALLDKICDLDADGSTLSHQTRLLFRTHTPAGRVAFVAAWAGFTAWWVPHVLDPLRQSSGT